MTDLETKVLSQIDAARDEIADLTAHLVRVPSISGDEGAASAVAAAWLESHGFETELKVVTEEFRDRTPGLEGERNLDQRPNVFAWSRSGCGRGQPPIVLNGHLDVVPPGDPDAWDEEPFGGVRSEGVVWGRGSVDMKGPIAAAMVALRTLRAAEVDLGFDVQLQCVIGEESSSIGSRSALATEPRPAAVIVLEPSDNVVISAGGGALQFTVEVDGVAAHSAVPWTGQSALERLVACYDALVGFAAERNARPAPPLFAALPQAVPFAIGTFHAGEWRAMLPEHGLLSGRFGLLPGEQIADLRAELTAVLSTAAEQDRRLAGCIPKLTWPNAGFPAWATDVNDPLVEALLAGSERIFGSRRHGAVTFGADAGYFSGAGIPTVIFGPGRIERAHMANEGIAEHDLVTAAQTLAIALMRLGRLRGADPS